MNDLSLRLAILLLSILVIEPLFADVPHATDKVDPVVRHVETVELTAGPDVQVTFDADAWKLSSTPRQGALRMSWRSVDDASSSIWVYSRGENVDEKAFREKLDLAQKVKKAPGVFVGSRREKFAGHEWMVVEYHFPTGRPTSREFGYFTRTKKGHVYVSVSAEEGKLPERRKAIADFLSGVRIE